MKNELLEHLKSDQASFPLSFAEPGLETCSRIASGNNYVLDRFDVPGLTCNMLSLPHHDAAAGGALYYVTVCGYRMKSKFVLIDARGPGDASTILASRLTNMIGRIAGQPNNDQLLQTINAMTYRQADTLPALASVSAATYNSHDASWTYAYAAHPGMLIYRNGSWSELKAEGDNTLPAGLLRESRYYQTATTLQLGDRVLMYSHGVLNTISRNKASRGVAALLDLASSITAPEVFFERFIERLVDINHGTDFGEDLTLLLIERKE